MTETDVCCNETITYLMESAKQLHIDGFGYATCTLLVEKLDIHHIWDLLRFNYEYLIRALPGFTDDTAALLYRNLRCAIGTRFDYEIGAILNIPDISKDLFKQIFRHIHWKLLFTDPALNELDCLLSKTQLTSLIEFIKNNRDDMSSAFYLFKPISSYITSYQPKGEQ